MIGENEIRELIKSCYEQGRPLRHKYLGDITIVSIEDDGFHADCGQRGILPFRYYDYGKVIVKGSIKEKQSNPIQDDEKSDPQSVSSLGFDPSLYGKHRKTSFPYSGTTNSERRHNLNSSKSLRKKNK